MTNGRCVAERDPKHCDVAELQTLMLGKELSDQYGRGRGTSLPARAAREVRLRVDGLAVEGAFEPVSFDLAAGEVLGIAGVEGSGREMLCRALFGAESPTAGTIRLDGSEVVFHSPADAVDAGIGYVPAERRVEGIVGGLSVMDNMTLAHSEVVQRGPFIDAGRERALARTWIERLGIKTPSADTPAGNLSGGNQQKVVLAKWLIATNTRVLILDHPMRGLDVGAKAEIFALVRGLAGEGIGVLLIADTLDELIALSNTIVVMRDGRISGRFDLAEAVPSRLQILERMV
jgi:ribose transport system ATP-binding protein